MHVKLNNGIDFPIIGVGTYLMRDEVNLREIISTAFKIGYRLIDTARVYRNEEYIGKIMANLGQHGLKREDVYLTTKLGPSEQGEGTCRKAILDSIQKLQVSYLDLVLIHWPGTSSVSHQSPKNLENRQGSWRDLESLQKEGLVKSIGVSNYTVRHLQEMDKYANIKPAVNQVEIHPLYFDKPLIDYCHQHDIVVQAYSSLGAKDGWPVLASNETLQKIANKYHKSVAQILLKWAVQHNLCIIPKTSQLVNLKANFNLFDFEISPEDMVQIDNLNKNEKFCWDPNVVA